MIMYAIFDRIALRLRAVGAQRGVMLIELIVIMIIIAILLGLVLSLLRAPRTTTRIKGAIAAGQTYSDAVQMFALDHGGRVPEGGNPREWASGANIGRGPLHQFGKLANTYYIRGGIVPEAVVEGSVTITFGDSAGSASGGNLAYIPKTSGGAPFPNGFEIKIYVRQKHVCSLGDDLGAAGPADNNQITCQ